MVEDDSMVEDLQCGCVTPSVRRKHIVSKVEGVQHGGGYAIRTCHIINTDVSLLRILSRKPRMT